jgi:hypothetical protein
MLMPRAFKPEKDFRMLPPRAETSGQCTMETPFSA